MKVAIKNKSEMKYIDSAKIQIGNITLEELANIVNKQNEIIKDLLEQIKHSHLVKKDTPYIIKLQDKLVKIDKLEIVAVEKLPYALRMYEMKDGELKLDKKKVVAI